MNNICKNITLPIRDERLYLALRTAQEGDLPHLRQWKNEQREYFFYKDEISPEQHTKWFTAYQNRPEDFMFIVIVGGNAVGCMGIRLIDDAWDVYNVILGIANHGGMGIMSKALQAMLCFAADRRPILITLQVLRHNPAVVWYQKNGFNISSEKLDHYIMTFQPANIRKETL